MTLKRALTLTARAALVGGFGAACFFVGSMIGPRAQLASLNMKAEENGAITAYLSLNDADWSGQDIAEAICATRSDIESFHQTYALTGPGLHYLFSCSALGKDTL